MTPEQLKQCAAAMIAFADDRPIQFSRDNEPDVWIDTTSLYRITELPHRPKPEPKTRPWLGAKPVGVGRRISEKLGGRHAMRTIRTAPLPKREAATNAGKLPKWRKRPTRAGWWVLKCGCHWQLIEVTKNRDGSMKALMAGSGYIFKPADMPGRWAGPLKLRRALDAAAPRKDARL